jgi:hypothetical protein
LFMERADTALVLDSVTEMRRPQALQNQTGNLTVSAKGCFGAMPAAEEIVTVSVGAYLQSEWYHSASK